MSSTSSANSFTQYFKNIMSDDCALNNKQVQVEGDVKNWFELYTRHYMCKAPSPGKVSVLIVLIPRVCLWCKVVHVEGFVLSTFVVWSGIKQALGLDKRSRTSYLLHTLGVVSIQEGIRKQCATLIKWIYSIQTPVKKYFLSQYIVNGELITGAIIEHIVLYSMASPLFLTNTRVTVSGEVVLLTASELF